MELQQRAPECPTPKELMRSITFPALTPATSDDSVISALTFCKEPNPRQGLESSQQLRAHLQAHCFACFASFFITGEQEANCSLANSSHIGLVTALPLLWLLGASDPIREANPT